MADNSRWFKLWCSAVGDPDLDNLDISDFGRWAKLGAITKEHGESGVLTIKSPSRSLCAKMQVTDWDGLLSAISRLPNISIEEDSCYGTITVTFHNWTKYQEDTTVNERMRKWRERRSVTVQEEKRGEEKRGDIFERFWKSYPRKVAKTSAYKAWSKINFTNGLFEKILSAVESQSKSDQWKKDHGKYIPHPATWLNQCRWEDELEPAKQGDPGLSGPRVKDPGL